MKASPFIPLSLAFLIPLAGCGGDGRPELIEATGTVTLNGEPLGNALISFKPVEGNPIMRPSRAKTDAQGNFRPGTYAEGDGIPLGTYQVGIEKRQLVGELPKGFDPESPEATRLSYEWITPRELASPDTSGLQVEVTESGLKPASLDLNRPGKPEIETTGGKTRRSAGDP